MSGQWSQYHPDSKKEGWKRGCDTMVDGGMSHPLFQPFFLSFLGLLSVPGQCTLLVNMYLCLQGMVASAQPVASEPPAWDSMPHSTGYHPPPAAAPAPTLLPKTVDYGHGHGKATPLVDTFTFRAFSRPFYPKRLTRLCWIG